MNHQSSPATPLALAPLQQVFQDFVLGNQDEAAMLPHIAEGHGLSGPERLSIYSNAYRVRLRDALSEAFDKTHRYLGDELFYQASAAYIAQNPSPFANLRWYGTSFPAFLAQYLPEHPAVAELAAFEWQLSLAFDAPDQACLALSALGQVAAEEWESIGFSLHASARFLPLHSNCVEIWLALGNDTGSAENAAGNGDGDGDQQAPPPVIWQTAPQTWLIWRKDLQAHFRSLSASEYQALSSLHAGHGFAEVCGEVAERDPEAEAQIGHWLQRWISDQVLHDFNGRT
ncbi:MAG: hypothetical protein RL748_3525 [Pseudomonadota bacterium]|jgi:hypothetical protein